MFGFVRLRFFKPRNFILQFVQFLTCCGARKSFLFSFTCLGSANVMSSLSSCSDLLSVTCMDRWVPTNGAHGCPAGMPWDCHWALGTGAAADRGEPNPAALELPHRTLAQLPPCSKCTIQLRFPALCNFTFLCITHSSSHPDQR